MSPTSGLVTEGHFQTLDESSVFIRFAEGVSPLLSEPFSCLSFRYDGRPRVFFSSIRGIIEEGYRDIAFAIPSEVFAAERRHSVRVPATDAYPVYVRVDSGLTDDLGEGIVVDLSLGGVRVEFPLASALTRMSTKVLLSIVSEHESLTIPARALREDHRRCGFCFETPVESVARSGLVRILQRLEDAWASTRASQFPDRPGFINVEPAILTKEAVLASEFC